MMRFVLICSRSYRDERPRRAGGGKMRSIVVAATTRGTYASRGDRSGPSAGATHSGACVTGILARALALAVVATARGSYMGITSFLMAEADVARVAEGKPRAVKAIWADIPMADAYRDVTFQGGSLNASFIPLWLGLVSGLSALPPASLSANPEEAAALYLEHLLSNLEFSGTHVVGAALGEEPAYDGPFYRLRSPVVRARELTIPVVVRGGWWDLFQRGEPLLWESLKHSTDRVLFMSPHYHIGSGPEVEDPKLKEKL